MKCKKCIELKKEKHHFKPNNMTQKKPTRGRPKIYTEPTRSLSAQVPVSHYERLKTILEYELDKLKIKN